MRINKENFSLGELFKKIIKKELGKIHTSIPAEIVTVNSNNTVDVKPLVKDLNQKGEYESLPVISGVPVRFFRTSVALISVPINKGDQGTLVFSERGIKNWQTQGKEQVPEDKRRFHLIDCYFSADLLKDGEGPSLTSDLQIILKNSKIIIKDTGDIIIDSSGFVELGAGATQKAILGDILKSFIDDFIGVYNSHGHSGSNTPPSEQATPLDGSELSTKVKLK